ncbi:MULTISPECIES: hypothetical protein [unclassified Microbacterium]|uniref:hypothetical protein n=1 Tax=unclassified Microbacterium TaxID=2609290 RepID=UPI001D900F9B|nr:MULTISPECIES: hypothetical protein [unclassified Microbacterium]CAH0214175.1 hypothetical protein SRABI121_02805 [Microbacterium sp. Bi121]HWK76604.1 hypothetical protein [Microbacterium sp.]
MSDAWVALLDRFEADLDEATAVLAPWTPPTTPIPAHLHDRAHTVLRRQQERIALMGQVLDDVRHQLEVLRMVPADGRWDAPAYLDVNG